MFTKIVFEQLKTIPIFKTIKPTPISSSSFVYIS